MKVPISWLKSFVDVEEDVSVLADKLTFAGLEVESIDPVGKDQVMELEITPNRPDCLSMIGIAREISALYHTSINMPKVRITPTGKPDTKIEIENKAMCPRYTLRVIDNVTVGPSPVWMKERLESVGIRSINNIVDITNYVMLETGHPLHAFDANCIEGNHICIRGAKANEEFKALDGSKHKLQRNMLVIADVNQPVALAGIMGGLNSEIKENTTKVLLEAACFDTASVRKTAKQLGLHTDSSYRFQRGICSASVSDASDRAASLIVESVEAASVSEIIDVDADVCKPEPILFAWSKMSDSIGVDIPKDDISDILKRLSIKIENDNGSTAVAIAPSFRMDLSREIDLVEEVARIFGMQNIPEQAPTARVILGENNDRFRAISKLRRFLEGLGLSEIMNYTLVNHTLLDHFKLDDKEEREELPHPISEEQSVLRTSLIPQVVESLGRNASRQISEASFYEIGRVFKRSGKDLSEYEHLAIGMMGPVGRSALNKRSIVKDEEQFIWLKGLVEDFLSKLGLKNIIFKPMNIKGLEVNQSVHIEYNGKLIGALGMITQAAKDVWRLHVPIAVAEFGLNGLIQEINTISPLKEIPIYPSVTRDLALIVDDSITHQSILQVVKEANIAELEAVKLFDIYKGKGIGKGKKSLAYNFTYRSKETTLTDEQVNDGHKKIMDLLSSKLPAEIRE